MSGENRERRRVVITGLGTVNPLGTCTAAFWDGLCAGRSGVGPITRFDASAFPVHFGGEVKGFDPSALLNARAVRRMDRFSQFAVFSAAEAIRDSGLDLASGDPFRRGVILGCSIGGLNEFEDGHGDYLRGGPRRISPYFIPKMMPNAAPASVAIEFELMGPSSAVASACSSAADAIGEAFRGAAGRGGRHALRRNRRHAHPHAARWIRRRAALSTRNDAPQAASRPFDRDRDGFVVSEGAGILVLEDLEHARRRRARIYAELLGHGRTNDAHGIAAPIRRAGARPEPSRSPSTTRPCGRIRSTTSTPTPPARRKATRSKPGRSNTRSALTPTFWRSAESRG